MNKKALESRTIIIFLVLFVILLIILFITLGTKGVEQIINKPKSFLPWLGGNETRTVQSQLLRYEIATDELKWYDGLSWQKFQNGEAELENKKLSETAVKTEITNQYFKPRQSESFPITDQSGFIIYPAEKKMPVSYCVTMQSIIPSSGSGRTRGDIIIPLMRREQGKCTQKQFGLFTLTSEKKLFFEEINTELYTQTRQSNDEDRAQRELTGKIEEVTGKWPMVYNEILPKANAWENSILSSPVKLSFQQKTTINQFEPKQDYFCIRKVENKYLKVDLSEIKSQTSTC